MAVQTRKGQRPAQILRTPAPDEVTRIRDPQGGDAYGQNSGAGNPSAIPPGKGGPQSLLGRNLRDSVDDPVIASVIEKGVAGRGDELPADGNEQQRPVSATPYPAAHGLVRQQANLADIGKNSLSKTLGASAAPDPRTDQNGGVKS